MDAIWNEKKKLGESEIRNLRKRNPINRRTNNPLPTIPKKTAKKNQSSNQGGSSSNSEKKNPDLSNKLGKDGKLTQAERTRRFNNNLCLFCGGVGYNWLTRYNPLIDWVLSSIIFPANRVKNPVSEPTSLRATVSEELETTDTTKPHDYDYDSDFHDSESHDSNSYEPDTPAPMNPPNYAKIDIALVNAVAYQCACQLPGSQSFSITLSNGEPRHARLRLW